MLYLKASIRNGWILAQRRQSAIPSFGATTSLGPSFETLFQAEKRLSLVIAEPGIIVLEEQRQDVGGNTRNGSADAASSWEIDPHQDGDKDAVKSSFGLEQILEETVEGNVEA